MPKNSKTEQTNGSAPQAADSNAAAEATPETKKRVKSAKTASKKTAAKKTTAKSSGKKIAARRPAHKNKPYEPSDEEVRLRAYFLAERRVQSSQAGDAAQDWLDARQQLIEEFGQRGS